MKKFIFLVVVLLLLASLERKHSMAIDFNHTVNQVVDFGAQSAVQLIQSKTIMFWIDLDTTTDGDFFGLSATDYANEVWDSYIESAKIKFFANFSTTNGIWQTNSSISTGRHHVAITYNYSSTSNDPIIYIDGVSVSISESSTPVGSYMTGTTNTFKIGAPTVLTYPFDGRMNNALVYNRILTAAEIADAYSSRLAIPDYRGLVFAPAIWAGGADGSTVTTIIDNITGASGAASASPVFKQDTYLTFK